MDGNRAGCVWVLVVGMSGLWGAQSAKAHGGATAEIQQLSQQLNANPGNVTSRQRRAMLLLRSGRLDEASADLVWLRTSRRDDPITALLSAELYLARGASNEAEAELDVAVSAGLMQALRLRAQLRERGGRAAEALADYQQMMRVQPTVRAALGVGRMMVVLGRGPDAARALGSAASRLGGAVVLIEARVKVLRDLGRFDEAVRALEPWLQRARATARVRLLRAELLDADGRAADARRERAVALDDARRVFARRRSTGARLWLARALLANGERDAARAQFERVRGESRRLAPEASEALDAMGGAR